MALWLTGETEGNGLYVQLRKGTHGPCRLIVGMIFFEKKCSGMGFVREKHCTFPLINDSKTGNEGRIIF